ncbi:hypothetical protein SCHPADRAFT_947802 [Schizopora paradoxa]|uniref:Uncharacterized protein n=1 Tax=Schizopora paradoxa TaxID=27342 RepID=A0A0H2RHF7_9AGAM|nr:hypothetical protein SCHPADRAFT_947802 [Schizopora paradoxa]
MHNDVSCTLPDGGHMFLGAESTRVCDTKLGDGVVHEFWRIKFLAESNSTATRRDARLPFAHEVPTPAHSINAPDRLEAHTTRSSVPNERRVLLLFPPVRCVERRVDSVEAAHAKFGWGSAKDGGNNLTPVHDLNHDMRRSNRRALQAWTDEMATQRRLEGERRELWIAVEFCGGEGGRRTMVRIALWIDVKMEGRKAVEWAKWCVHPV